MKENKKRQFSLKKIARTICLYLILSIVANIFGIYFGSNIARAVDTNYPASDGNYTAWTPTGGAAHYTQVNDTNDATYVRTTSDNDLDSYGLTGGQLPSGSNVTQIIVYARAHRFHAAKTASFTIFYRNGGADTFGGTSHSMTNAWADYSQTWSGLSWTDTTIDSLEIGIRLDAHQGGSQPSVSEMWIEVTYYAITTLTTDAGAYPTLGETITVDSTVENGSSAIVAGSTGDYVIFIDGDADNTPDPGETYMYTTGVACDTSGIFGTDGPDFTDQWAVPNVAVDGNQSDQWTCDNDNFPSNTTYTLWMKWYDGGTTYDTAYVTFTSVPTLTEILFIVLVGCAVFLAIKTGAVKLKKQKDPDPKDTKTPPVPSVKQNLDNHQSREIAKSANSQSRSVDGITLKQNRKNYGK